MNCHSVVLLQLPDWMECLAPRGGVYPTGEERMRLVIHLARENIDRSEGGPFGAAVFERESGRLVASGVNIVVRTHCSVAHAEAVAVMRAQQLLKTHDLSAPRLPAMELVTSAQPCNQCLGILWWSGISRLVIGASREAVESITGFDEGPLPDRWREDFRTRRTAEPVEVVEGVLHEESCSVLRAYMDRGGPLYGPGDAGTAD